MFLRMLFACECDQIRNFIVERVAVAVVHNQAVFKWFVGLFPDQYRSFLPSIWLRHFYPGTQKPGV